MVAVFYQVKDYLVSVRALRLSAPVRVAERMTDQTSFGRADVPHRVVAAKLQPDLVLGRSCASPLADSVRATQRLTFLSCHPSPAVISGITVGLVLVPQSMSYAKLANLDPQYGLYSSFIGVVRVLLTV